MMRKSNKGNKYKLTPAKTKELENTAKIMPAVPLMDKTGRPTFTMKPERLTGAQVLERKINKPGDEIDIKANYTVQHRIPNYMNHRVNLFSHYQQHGDQGVKDYIEGINQLYDAMKAMREAMSKRNIEKITTSGAQPEEKVIVDQPENTEAVQTENNLSVADKLLDDNIPVSAETPAAAKDEESAG